MGALRDTTLFKTILTELLFLMCPYYAGVRGTKKPTFILTATLWRINCMSTMNLMELIAPVKYHDFLTEWELVTEETEMASECHLSNIK